jgi:hypothetical protein
MKKIWQPWIGGLVQGNKMVTWSDRDEGSLHPINLENKRFAHCLLRIRSLKVELLQSYVDYYSELKRNYD